MMQKWLENRQYLPPILRDFTTQKHLFKCIHSTVDIERSVQNPPNWIDAQCYVIDVFLWYMAKRGYTLQRTRNRSVIPECRDLQQDLDLFEQQQLDLLHKELNKHNG